MARNLYPDARYAESPSELRAGMAEFGVTGEYDELGGDEYELLVTRDGAVAGWAVIADWDLLPEHEARELALWPVTDRPRTRMMPAAGGTRWECSCGARSTRSWYTMALAFAAMSKHQQRHG